MLYIMAFNAPTRIYAWHYLQSQQSQTQPPLQRHRHNCLSNALGITISPMPQHSYTIQPRQSKVLIWANSCYDVDVVLILVITIILVIILSAGHQGCPARCSCGKLFGFVLSHFIFGSVLFFQFSFTNAISISLRTWQYFRRTSHGR